MARYEIKEEDAALTVELTEVADKQDKLMEAFGECQSGHCTCQTDEYQKLAAMDVRQAGDHISLRLASKPGEKFDKAEIAACLDYTTAKVTAAKGEE